MASPALRDLRAGSPRTRTRPAYSSLEARGWIVTIAAGIGKGYSIESPRRDSMLALDPPCVSFLLFRRGSLFSGRTRMASKSIR